MSISENRVLAKMMCPECLEIMRGPIMLCARGHSVCSDCRLSRDNCPVCRSPFSDNRNVLAENIIASVFIQSYKNLIRNYISTRSRERIFPNATIPSEGTLSCRVCGNLIHLQGLASHFKTAHPANVLRNGQSRTVRKREVNESFAYTFQLESGGVIYWFWRRNEGETVRFGVQYVGGGDPAVLKMFVMDVVSPDRAMNVRFKALVSRSRDGRCHYRVVGANVLGVGARFRVTVV